MHIPWSEVELLLAIEQAGSLSGAAKLLHVTQPTVSRRLVELEALVGEPLFARSVEGAALTSFGERILEPARRMADAALEVDDVARGADTQPRGVVRVTAPPGVANEFLAPFAGLLRTKLPDIRLEIISTISYLDLARREADLALRFPPLDRASTQRGLITLASRERSVGAYAMRDYIATLPRAYTIADVGWIGWAPPFEHVSPNPQLAALIPGFHPVFASDDLLVQLEAAVAGVGAIPLGKPQNPRAPESPLVEMKLDFGKLTVPLHLVCAQSSLSIPRVKAVAELLAREIQTGVKRPRAAAR